MEDALLREQVEAYNRRLKEFEEHRKMQQRQIALIMGQHQQALAAAAAAAAATASAISMPSLMPEPTSPLTDKSPERVLNLEVNRPIPPLCSSAKINLVPVSRREPLHTLNARIPGSVVNL